MLRVKDDLAIMGDGLMARRPHSLLNHCTGGNGGQRMTKDEKPLQDCPDDREVLETAMDAGHILLENGAEIFRVEETMERIAAHYGVARKDFFVLSNGIFTTGDCQPGQRGGQYARVQHIPVKSAQLNRVVAVNQLSREIEAGRYTLEEARQRLREIRLMPSEPPLVQMLASGVGSACFCGLFGGGLEDCAAAFAAGYLLYVFVLWAGKRHISKIVANLLGGALVTLSCIVLYRLGLGRDMNHMIIGAIIPLVPGVPFTNGIRDIANGDYISGAVRLLDAILVFLCIAIGVGVMFTIYQRFAGGVLL